MTRDRMTRERRLEIIAFAKKKDWSLQLIADYFGVTRNSVAGVMFRHRHPYATRVDSPGCPGSKNKIGTGRHGPGKWPAKHALNTR